jgi:ketosteroid isomerase-like protein
VERKSARLPVGERAADGGGAGGEVSARLGIGHLRDTRRAMTDESATPDPIELVRGQFEAANRRDLDAVVSTFAVDAVLDGRALGDHYEGRAAIRGFVLDWFRAWEALDFELEEISDLGGGVVFAVVVQDGRLVGGDGHVRQREGWVYLWVEGSVARFAVYEVGQARSAAELLAQERA